MKCLASACIGAVLICHTAVIEGAPAGWLEGQLNILQRSEVDLAEAEAAKSTPAAESYSHYPLVVLDSGAKREIARLVANETGRYRIELPPGDYVLDVQDRARKHLRAKPKPFTVVSNQTVHVDLDIDTGVR